MSKIALTPNASGSGTFTIAAPNSDTDRSLTLPDGAGTLDRLERTGNVLQVVNSVLLNDTSTTSTSYTSTGLSVTLTPSSTSSKVYLTLQGGGGSIASGSSLKLTFYRDATDIAPNHNLISNLYSSADTHYVNHSIALLDSPSTTSAVTYTVYMKTNTGTINFCWSDKGNPVLTAMEIAG